MGKLTFGALNSDSNYYNLDSGVNVNRADEPAATTPSDSSLYSSKVTEELITEYFNKNPEKFAEFSAKYSHPIPPNQSSQPATPTESTAPATAPNTTELS